MHSHAASVIHKYTPDPGMSYLEDGAVQVLDQVGLIVVGGGGCTPSRAVRCARQSLLGLRDECCCSAVVLGDVGTAGVEHSDEIEHCREGERGLGERDRREGGMFKSRENIRDQTRNFREGRRKEKRR